MEPSIQIAPNPRVEIQGAFAGAPPVHGFQLIAMKAHAMEEDRERCLRTGMDGYVSEPSRAAPNG